MRVLVCGSRDFSDAEALKKALLDFHFDRWEGPPALGKIDTIIAGEARGADMLAKTFAHRFSFKYQGFPALWNQYGKRAGYLRNQQMLDEGKPDIVFAFWDGQSRGTKMMIELAQKAGVEVKIFRS